jgi:hypothetical protein
MNKINNIEKFERTFVGILSIISGIVILFLAVQGPLILNNIEYKTNILIKNQILGQDIANIIIAPLIIVGGILLLFGKKKALEILILMPIYMIYYALSFGIGYEWSSAIYIGNNEKYSLLFIFIIISGLIILLYSLSSFHENKKAVFNKKGLILYSILFALFLTIFAMMWLKEVFIVINGGKLMSHEIAPTLFWVIRYFDLGFTIPLGYISLYLLWTRANKTYIVQMLFYGFFLTMIITVNAMGMIMYINKDAQFTFGTMGIFGCLLIIVSLGFLYIKRNYKENN